MTDPTTLLALADRCEQAAGPDRELDVAIARALGWKPLYRDDYSKWWPPAAVEDSRARKRSILHHPTQPLPAFTASLDAAVTLVPEGCDWHCQSNPSVTACWASVSPVKRGIELLEWGSGMRRASTPALALCAAALRARAAMAEHS
jgi:hypothetical protein